jgi:hypothetical protein
MCLSRSVVDAVDGDNQTAVVVRPAELHTLAAVSRPVQLTALVPDAAQMTDLVERPVQAFVLVPTHDHTTALVERPVAVRTPDPADDHTALETPVLTNETVALPTDDQTAALVDLPVHEAEPSPLQLHTTALVERPVKLGAEIPALFHVDALVAKSFDFIKTNFVILIFCFATSFVNPNLRTKPEFDENILELDSITYRHFPLDRIQLFPLFKGKKNLIFCFSNS